MSSNVRMNNPMMQLKKIVSHPYLVKWEVDAETGLATFSFQKCTLKELNFF